MARVREQGSSSKETTKFVWESPEPAKDANSKAPEPKAPKPKALKEKAPKEKAPEPSEPRVLTVTLPRRRVLVIGAVVVAVLAAGTVFVVEATGRKPASVAADGAAASARIPSAFTADPVASSLSASPSAHASKSASASASAHASTTTAASQPATQHSASSAAQSLTPSAQAVVPAPATSSSAPITAPSGPGPNLALGKAVSSSTNNGGDVAANVIDGNASTYWQSQVTSGSLNQWVQVDLGTPMTVSEVVMRLPPGWNSRTETIELYGLATGYDGFVIHPATTYTFSSASDDAVAVTFPALSTRYIQLIITGNSGVNAGQMSEVEVFG